MAALIIYYDKDGGSVITGKTLAQLLAGSTGTAQKFGVRNIGTRALGLASSLPAVQLAIAAILAGDGSTRLRIKKDTVTLSPPWGFAAVLSAAGATPAPTAALGAGGSVETGNHSWVYTYVTDGVESPPSPKSNVLNVSPASQVDLSGISVGPAGTTARKLYRTVSGDTGSWLLVDTINDNTTTVFTDNVADGNLGSAAGPRGAWGATGVYGAVLTATNATGQTIACAQVTFNVDDSSKVVRFTWTQLTGATGYKDYRTATPGTYGASSLRATIGSGATTTFIDDGSATSSGQPPSTNTSGGASPNYGTPPAGLDTATDPFTIGQGDGSLAIGETAFFWINRVVPSNSAPAGNPRSANIALTEG